MRIVNAGPSVPFSLIFDELEYGSPYRIEHIVDELVVCSFIRVGLGRSERKIPKITSLVTGEIFSVDQARHWKFRLVSAEVSV